ncbi:MAG: chalcone isomerase family protein [Steroidobacteraceae bacterium]|jgi:hypothetical protein|nr:chalcone isomerase family protein [Steroidobacteraceae bacterium]
MKTRTLPALALLAAAWLSLPALAAELPPRVNADGFELKPVGKGRLTWLGFGIYRAGLWTPDGRFEDFAPGGPVALSLSYERAFSRAQLIEITTGEWTRLGLATPAQRDSWARAIEGFWKDVRKGDNMTAVVVPGGETRFYDATGLVGRVTDPAFGPAYLRIWLDQRSAVSELRVALLGE